MSFFPCISWMMSWFNFGFCCYFVLNLHLFKTRNQVGFETCPSSSSTISNQPPSCQYIRYSNDPLVNEKYIGNWKMRVLNAVHQGWIPGGWAPSGWFSGFYSCLISPLRIGLWDPLQMAVFWLANGGDPITTYIQWAILQIAKTRT